MSYGNSRKGPWRMSMDIRGATCVVERLARSPRTVQSRREMERACSKETNRLVRIRMLGGVGGVRSNAAPIPMYAQHGRDLVGCKSPVFSSSHFFGSHHTRWIAHKKSTRGEGNCGEVTDRGEEACECSIDL